MNTEKYTPGIGVVAGVYRLKWDMINSHLKIPAAHVQLDTDEINVFINFECIIKNLSMKKGLLTLVNFHKQQMVIELESSILNLMANYKSYFKKNNHKVKLYFYHTAIDKEYPQQMSVYNKYYRNFYYNRYTQNPQFRQMGDVLNKIIIPELKLILSYIPDCYFLESKTFDGSLIPYIVSTFSSAKNVIVTGDVFDTLYLFNPNFAMLYIKRKYSEFLVSSDIDTTVQSIVTGESPFDLTIFNTELYYRLLLSIKGSKVRNIRSAKGFGYSKFMNLLKQGLDRDIVLRDFSAIDSVIQLFPADYRNDIKQAFQCTSIENQFDLLSETDIEEIKSQIIDKIDIESVEALNNKRFFEYPINLQMLLD